ncbi:Quinol monooxygenase YgiN [Pseudarcicella hirudinis]|uniref:Quinol monooxygenase YgiN n=1 Tax=Pseudarcicella hirudinis TaxID=1079859 RepID=A0A1I5SN29_9BACT|nr:putative quinol monooxygenase [Pseudarcicella hirudinis]SFP72108.1 Quinol monooxygenase YgiN [Pseudarcicella hirudinis]
MEFRKIHSVSIGGTGFLHGLSLVFTGFLLSLFSYGNASAQDKKTIVRVAKIQIDSTQLESYKAALKEGVETAIRLEPGVLALYAVSEKDNPTHITVFEIYASAEAYKAHLETPHFKKYKSTTKEMVKSLQLIDSEPIVLGAKEKK